MAFISLRHGHCAVGNPADVDGDGCAVLVLGVGGHAYFLPNHAKIMKDVRKVTVPHLFPMP